MEEERKWGGGWIEEKGKTEREKGREREEVLDKRIEGCKKSEGKKGTKKEREREKEKEERGVKRGERKREK